MYFSHEGEVCGWQVGYSALLFYGYVGVIGLALFAALKWWFKAEVGLAQVWCTYGARHAGLPSASGATVLRSSAEGKKMKKTNNARVISCSKASP